MDTIKRKKLLYKTKVDYQLGSDSLPVNDHALNHAFGCSHGCKYPCYAQSSAVRRGDIASYDEWCHPKPVEGAIDMMKRELLNRDNVRRIHMCFTTDPFPYVSDILSDEGKETNRKIAATTVELVKIANEHSIPITLLTKGVLPPLNSFADPDPENFYGISLVSVDESFRSEWEPNTAPYDERIAALSAIHDVGAKTWVSMEPFPAFDTYDGRNDENGFTFEVLRDCLEKVNFVDRIVFGRWNYNDDMPIHGIDDVVEWYDAAAKLVREYGAKRDIEVIVKRGTEKI